MIGSSNGISPERVQMLIQEFEELADSSVADARRDGDDAKLDEADAWYLAAYRVKQAAGQPAHLQTAPRS